ncbi:MAG: hypothetical protein LBU34_11485 [Planctomycetaceae bacterium]|nr:hypothetical protein [Planctomycetaceae bacterium]
MKRDSHETQYNTVSEFEQYITNFVVHLLVVLSKRLSSIVVSAMPTNTNMIQSRLTPTQT